MAYADLLPELRASVATLVNQQKKILPHRPAWKIRLLIVVSISAFCFMSIILFSSTSNDSSMVEEPMEYLKEVSLDAKAEKRLDAAEREQMARAASIWDYRKPVHPLLQSPGEKPHVQRSMVGKPKKKLILIYGDYYLAGTPPFLPKFNFDHCRVPHCEWTQDKSRAAEADAVWLHVANFGPRLDPVHNPVPPRPSPSQVWIAATSEWDAVSCSEAQAGLDDYVNWTMSFRRDSDVWWPYGYAVRRPKWLQKPNSLWDRRIDRIAGRKTKMVYFQSKHCQTESKRLEYVAELRQYIEVEGSNVKYECLEDPPEPWWKRQHKAFLKRYWPKRYEELYPEKPEWLHDVDLLAMLKNDYRFVVAFENSLCKDYITEKFWKMGLNADVIPIVRNGKEKDEIAKVAPPGSYINAREFRSPQELAAYLYRVASNRTLYASYFQWKKAYMLARDDEEDIRWNFEMASGDAITGFCQICEKLHAKKLEHKTVKWSGNWCWEQRGPEAYATPYSGCAFADDFGGKEEENEDD